MHAVIYDMLILSSQAKDRSQLNQKGDHNGFVFLSTFEDSDYVAGDAPPDVGATQIDFCGRDMSGEYI